MIRIAVVEDELSGVDHVLSHLDLFQREVGERFHIGAFHDGADILDDFRPDWDIIFLDIQMERVDGMTAARRIREVDEQVLIVFITSSPQYAISGYEVDALSYLLKPVAYGAFRRELKRCMTRLRRRERHNILLTTADGSHHRIDVADILYFESLKHHVLIHTLDGTYDVVTALKTMQAEVDGLGFFRCNHGLVVNLRHVTGVEGSDCRVRGGTRLPVSRPRKSDFLAALAGYIGEKSGTTG